jgi:hypothetical protein
MTLWNIQNGVPFDVAHCLPDWESLAYAIVFAQHKNGGKEWDWDRMTFIDKGR